MRKVAERIEYSPTTIYLYFADKETLFRELCSSDFQRFSASFLSAAQVPDPIERLRAAARIYLRFAAEYPNHYRLMFMAPHPVGPSEETLAHKGDPDEDAYAFLLSIVATAIEASAFRPEYKDPHLIAQTLWAAVHGVASLEITQKCEKNWANWTPFQDREQIMLEGIFRGLANPAPHPQE